MASLIRDHDRVVWTDHDLYFELPDSDLLLKGFAHCIARNASARQGSVRHGNFGDRISSQLFQYRLTTTFGMMPAVHTDGYKSCWEVFLAHANRSNCLYISDHKGGLTLRFKGTIEGSYDALDLLNFLCGKNIPHSYDGVLAGCVA